MTDNLERGRVLGQIDRALENLIDDGITSLTALRVLLFCRIPRRYEDIDRVISVDRTVVRKMIMRCPDLLHKRRLHQCGGFRERGKPAVEIMATAKAKRALNRLFPEL